MKSGENRERRGWRGCMAIMSGVLLLGSQTACASARIAGGKTPPGTPVPDPGPGEWGRAIFQDMGYRILLPANYDPVHHSYPLTVFLHGSGERGNDNEAQLSHGIRELATQMEIRAQAPAIIVAPQCPHFDHWGGSWYHSPSRVQEKVVDLVRNLIATLSVDPERVSVTGISMGGIGAWDLIVRYSSLFAAAMPVSGAGDADNAWKLTYTPIWAFHGALDDVVPPGEDQTMYYLIREAGGVMKYTEIPDVGHGGWSEIYLATEHWRWLTQQRRQPAGPLDPASVHDPGSISE